MHLATARVAGETEIVSTDKRMRDAAKRLEAVRYGRQDARRYEVAMNLDGLGFIRGHCQPHRVGCLEYFGAVAG